jgi:hypothetical protein
MDLSLSIFLPLPLLFPGFSCLFPFLLFYHLARFLAEPPIKPLFDLIPLPDLRLFLCSGICQFYCYPVSGSSNIYIALP